MDLLEDLRMSLLSVLVYNIFECFFKEFNRLFFTTYNEGNFKSGTKNIIEGIRNLSRLSLELSYTAIKNIRNPL